MRIVYVLSRPLSVSEVFLRVDAWDLMIAMCPSMDGARSCREVWSETARAPTNLRYGKYSKVALVLTQRTTGAWKRSKGSRV